MIQTHDTFVGTKAKLLRTPYLFHTQIPFYSLLALATINCADRYLRVVKIVQMPPILCKGTNRLREAKKKKGQTTWVMTSFDCSQMDAYERVPGMHPHHMEPITHNYTPN